MRGILRTASRSASGSSDPSRRKAGALFAAAVDSRRRKQRGIRPLEDDRQRIEQVRSVESLLELVARFHRQGTGGLFSTEVAPDERHSSVYALYVEQGGVALPDRDYYLLDQFADLRRQYRLHVERIFRLAGLAAAEARTSARAVLSVETRLARASRPRADLRDPDRNYHRFSCRELARRYPRLAWRTYLRRLGARNPPYVVVGQPEFFAALDRALGTVPLGTWKTYLLWRLLHDSAPHLDPRFERENFAFFHRRLLGQREPEPAWKRAATLVDGLLGEALGRLYVQRHFPPGARVRMLDLVEDIRAVFRARLERVPWMTARTRARAVAKFDRFVVKIGHPTRYRSYGRVRISPRDHFGNVRRARSFEVDRRIARIGRKVDRDEWHMTPPTVNAHFVPTQNQIFFPAGILQPPFFDPTMDDAVNLGGIGVVIGHEITHGYDDQGRKFDADGNLRDWWSPADAREFRRRAKRIVAQYSRFEPLPGVRLNGALTAGENIADLGGVSLAHEALERRLADGRTRRATIDGFTPEQRFFLSYGQIWRGLVRDGEQRRRVSVDPHSPGRFRVNGALANLEEFWRAFDVPPGSPMRQDPRRRVVIW